MVKKFPKRGEIYWGNLEPTIGAETKKLRPCLVLSNNIGNEISGVVIIAPITSNIKNIYPFEVAISIDKKKAKAMINQCRAVDKSRLGDLLGKVDIETMKCIDKAIKLVFSIT